MSHKKRPSKTQRYENYWKLTLEYSDIHGIKFSTTLNLILYFIDKYNSKLQKGFSSKLYKELQESINNVYPKSDQGSTRKSINQFVKLGFIKPGLQGYRSEAKSFINSKTDEERELIFSEIYYKYSSLNSSVTNDHTDTRQINFLLKTLMYHPKQQLTEDEIIGLMTVDITKINKGYLSSEELKSNVAKADEIDFIKRKYNQINYFMRYLRFIPGISVADDKSLITYTEDASLKLSGSIDVSRDPTMFRIMKEKIKQESIDLYGTVLCYLTKREQKGLVVSHIWRSEDALREMNVEAAYDYNNALILEPTTDQYFDKYDMTISKSGEPTFNDIVPQGLIDNLKPLKIDEEILTSSRKKYLDIHNKNFVKKNEDNLDYPLK